MVFIFCVRRSLWGLRVWLRVSCVSLYSESFQRVAEWIPSEFRCKLLGQFYSFEFRHVRICNVARGWSSIATFCKIDTSPLEVHLLFYPTVFLTSSQTFSRFCRWSVDDLFFCHFVVQGCIHSKLNRKLYSVASSRSDVTFMQSVIREHFSLLQKKKFLFAEFKIDRFWARPLTNPLHWGGGGHPWLVWENLHNKAFFRLFYIISPYGQPLKNQDFRDRITRHHQ